MNNHQGLKAEVDAREENFAICVNLGKDLVMRKHPRSQEVMSKFLSLSVLVLCLSSLCLVCYYLFKLLLYPISHMLDIIASRLIYYF